MSGANGPHFTVVVCDAEALSFAARVAERLRVGLSRDAVVFDHERLTAGKDGQDLVLLFGSDDEFAISGGRKRGTIAIELVSDGLAPDLWVAVAADDEGMRMRVPRRVASVEAIASLAEMLWIPRQLNATDYADVGSIFGSAEQMLVVTATGVVCDEAVRKVIGLARDGIGEHRLGSVMCHVRAHKDILRVDDLDCADEVLRDLADQSDGWYLTTATWHMQTDVGFSASLWVGKSGPKE